MKVDIFHADDALFIMSSLYRVNGAVFNAATARKIFETSALTPCRYIHVATLNIDAATTTDALEAAFAHSQNVDGPWGASPCRSTSVGDILRIGDDLHIVAGVGFDRLPPLP
jgi:hypothetical protein